LDSAGDLGTYISLPICLWLLWREVLVREVFFVAVALASYLVPLTYGLLKFRRLTSYHTWAAKLAAVAMSVSVLIMIVWDNPWPFRLSVPLFVVAAVEDMMITAMLLRWQPNIRTVGRARQLAAEQRACEGGGRV
jgi:CDP-diacylglycerol--glycerol-3-phosphate 3-phosphatidyltransferase